MQKQKYEEILDMFSDLDEKSRSLTTRILLAKTSVLIADRPQARQQLKKARAKLQEILKLLDEIEEELRND